MVKEKRPGGLPEPPKEIYVGEKKERLIGKESFLFFLV